MWKNYLKIAIRNLMKYKGYSFINVTGLTIGMACCFLILLWIQDEISYNKFHEKLDDIYVVVTSTHFSSRTVTWPGSPPAFGPAVEAEYPEIINSVRLNNGTTSLIISYNDKKFRGELQAADPSILEMFTFPLVKGDPATALSEPHSIVMTEKMAEKYFGEEEPIGKILKIENDYDFKVTGILKNIPLNSTIRFDFLIPLQFLEEIWQNKNYTKTWRNFSFQTYIQLQKGIPYKTVDEKLADRLKREGEENVDVFIQPFSRLHLYWLDMGGGRIQLIRLFGLIASFVLFIACINFMNLSTARSGNRAKEIGMRKVAGAHRKDVIKQFYGESVLLSLLSFLFALLIVILIVPSFNNLVHKELTLNLENNPVLIFALFIIAIITGIIAGSYPALYMSSFQPVSIIKGATTSGSKSRGAGIRKTLVVVQFTISIVLIIGAIVVYRQLEFMRNKNLGFDKEHLVYIPVNGELVNHYDAVKQELIQNPGILSATVSSHLPTGVWWNGSDWEWDGKNPEVNPWVTYLSVDVDFLETLKIDMIQGSFFTKEARSGNERTIIINEEFAEVIGKETLVGERLTHGNTNYIIKGVVKNFHFKPLREQLDPLILFYKSRVRFMIMRIHSGDIPETIQHIGTIYKKYNPEFPFEYTFLDEDFDRLYRGERQLGLIIRYFTAIALCISCLGLFGLASFMAEQRTKEIGIRKVLGSSVSGIMILFSKDFVKWVLIANLIALPLGWIITTGWLYNYAFRISIGIPVFILTGLLSLAIAIVTVSYQTFKSARRNPVKSLRYE